MPANQPDRRTRCLMCGGRCDPARYTCRRCNQRLWQEIGQDLIDAALAAQEAPCTSPRP